MRCSLYVAVAACILLAGCGGKKRVSLPGAARVGSTETGVASWYGHPYHGRRAANGEIYDMEQMTAAHRTLPFGTWVRVKNLNNDKTVDVRITDRGPFIGGRIIDLSHTAAVSIDMIGPGTAKVKITVIVAPEEIDGRQVRASARRRPAAPARHSASPATVCRAGGNVHRPAQRGTCAIHHGATLRTAPSIVMREAQPAQWRVLVGSEADRGGRGNAGGTDPQRSGGAGGRRLRRPAGQRSGPR